MSEYHIPGGPVDCKDCGERLTDEEIAYPVLGGELICEQCYIDTHKFTCTWCEEHEDKDLVCEVGSLFVLFEAVNTRPPLAFRRCTLPLYSFKNHLMRPGVYRIRHWPIYWDGVIECGLYADAFEWFGPLPEEWRRNGGYAGCPCGPLCLPCQWKLKHAKWRPGWPYRTGRI